MYMAVLPGREVVFQVNNGGKPHRKFLRVGTTSHVYAMDFLPEQEDFPSFSLLCSLTLQDGCDSCITQSLLTLLS